MYPLMEIYSDLEESISHLHFLTSVVFYLDCQSDPEKNAAMSYPDKEPREILHVVSII